MIAETQTIVVPVGALFSLFVLWPIRAYYRHRRWKYGGMTWSERRFSRRLDRRYPYDDMPGDD